MPKSDWIHWSGLAAILAGSLWTASWVLNAQTDEGNRVVLGLTEGNVRALLNPALLGLLFGLAGLYAFHAGQLGKLGRLGFALSCLSLALTLVGNVLEFGLFGQPTNSIGWGIFILAYLVLLPIGMCLFGLAVLRARALPGWGRAWPLVIGVMLISGVLAGVMEMLRCHCPRADTPLGFMLLSTGIGWIVLGCFLWASTGQGAVQLRHTRQASEGR